jgi:hypothetical protein
VDSLCSEVEQRTGSITAKHYAEVRRDIGLACVETSAGVPWVERAADLVARYARKHQGPFLCEDVRAAAAGHRMIEDPPNSKAWGAAMQLARHRGAIRSCGYAPANSSNRSPKVLWEQARG